MLHRTGGTLAVSGAQLNTVIDQINVVFAEQNAKIKALEEQISALSTPKTTTKSGNKQTS